MNEKTYFVLSIWAEGSGEMWHGFILNEGNEDTLKLIKESIDIYDVEGWVNVSVNEIPESDVKTFLNVYNRLDFRTEGKSCKILSLNEVFYNELKNKVHDFDSFYEVFYDNFI